MITIVGTMIVGLSACQNTQMASKEAVSATGSSEQMQDDSIATAQAAALAVKADEVPDMEAPLTKQQRADMYEEWNKRHNVMLENHLNPGHTLVNRLYRELREWSTTLHRPMKFKSILLETHPQKETDMPLSSTPQAP